MYMLSTVSISTKEKTPPLTLKPVGNSLQRTATNDDDQFVRVKDANETIENKEQRPSYVDRSNTLMIDYSHLS
jgi:hypothetical protein